MNICTSYDDRVLEFFWYMKMIYLNINKKKKQTAKVPLSLILVTDSKQIQASTGVKTVCTLYVLLAPKISNIFTPQKTHIQSNSS